MSLFSQITAGLPQGAFSSNQGMGGKQPGEKVPSGYRKYAVQNFTPEQMELFSQMQGMLGPDGFLAKLAGGDQSQFDEIEAPALRQFNELQGNLASRFSGMGMGARKSSGFQNASNAAAQDFASQLQSNRQGLTRQALQDLMGYSDALMNQRPYDVGLSEKRRKDPSFLQSMGMTFANSAAKSFGEGIGNAGSAALFA